MLETNSFEPLEQKMEHLQRDQENQGSVCWECWSLFICLSYYIFPVGPEDLLLPFEELENVLSR